MPFLIRANTPAETLAEVVKHLRETSELYLHNASAAERDIDQKLNRARAFALHNVAESLAHAVIKGKVR